MNFLKNALGKVLYKIYSQSRPNHSPDFFARYKKVKKIKHDIQNSFHPSNIIVAPFLFANTHIFEAIYARKAMFEGKTVYSFFCGQGIEYCEKNSHDSRYKNIRCELCFQMQQEFVKQIDTVPCYIFQEITSDDAGMIDSYISSFVNTGGELPQFMEIDIKKILLSALQRYYFRAEPSMEVCTVTIGFLRTILVTLIAFDKLCNRIHPEYVLVSHGTYSSWGSIVEYCKTRAIRVIVWGRVYHKLGIYFANNESYLIETVIGNNDKWKNQELTNNEKNQIVQYINMRTGQGKSEFVYDYNKNQKQQFSREEICKILDIPKEAKLVGMFPNIPWDGSVCGITEAFPIYRDWVTTTIDFFSNRQNVFLLIRRHPAEKEPINVGQENLQSLISHIYKQLPNNVIMIPPDSKINSFAVGKASLFGVYYCSTVGMELTYLGIPLVCAGLSPLRNKNIVYDAHSRSEYIQLLERGLNSELTVSGENRGNLLKYAYYQNFVRVMPESFIEFHGATFKRLLFDSEEYIRDDEVLDCLFRAIESKGEYDFRKFYK